METDNRTSAHTDAPGCAQATSRRASLRRRVTRAVFRPMSRALGCAGLLGAFLFAASFAPAGAQSAGPSNDAAVSMSTSALGESYSLLTTTGQVIGLGAAFSATPPVTPAVPTVGIAATPDGRGAWAAAVDGGVFSFGDAVFFGSMGGIPLNQPVVGIAATPDGNGYWLVAADGGIFSFGDAVFQGSTGSMHLNQPVVGIAATPDGKGYWLVAADGGIFSFGDAVFQGSTGSIHLNQPIVGMTATPDGKGYWLVATDGGIFSFGDAVFFGSMGGTPLNQPVVGMTSTPDGNGYWLVAADGGIFSFGNAAFYGSAQGSGQRIVGMVRELGGYQNPLRAVSGLSPERIDQGVDYGGGGPIFAIGDGVVLNTTNSGWPGGAFISYQLSDGPAAGDIVYVAENVIPAVQIGQTVSWNTVLGTLINAYPNLETGWADPPGDGESLARASGQWTAAAAAYSFPTAYGSNFSDLLAALGAPPGISYGPVQGSVAPGWPTW